MNLLGHFSVHRVVTRQRGLPWYAPYRDDPVVRYGALGFLLVGVFFLTMALFMHQASSRRTATAQGTIVAVQETRDTEGDWAYYPVVEFTTGQGRLVRFRSSSGSSWNEYPVGKAIKIVYDPARPRDAALGSDWILTLAFGLGGTMSTLLGSFLLGGVLVFSSQQRRR